jgi:DHA1 family bicyclomycin/chloramphenicol resistance-like MFS transporter
MISKYDAQKMLIISSRICIFGLLVIAVITFSQSTNPLLYTLAFLPFDIATIIPTTLLAPLCLSYMPKAKGRISAIMQGMRLILMALGLQIASYFYLSSFHSIGMVIASFIIVVAITMFMILKNKKIMHLAKEK